NPPRRRGFAADLDRAPRDAAVLPVGVHYLLARAPCLAAPPARVSRRQCAAARAGRGTALARARAAAHAGRLAGGGGLRSASGAGRIRRLDHRAEECSLDGVLPCRRLGVLAI